jgi:hypothetical protein
MNPSHTYNPSTATPQPGNLLPMTNTPNSTALSGTISPRITEPTNLNSPITPQYMLLKPQKPTWSSSATKNTPLNDITSIRSNHSTPPVKNPPKVSSVRTKKQSVPNISQRLNLNLTATKPTPLADITSLVLNLNKAVSDLHYPHPSINSEDESEEESSDDDASPDVHPNNLSSLQGYILAQLN